MLSALLVIGSSSCARQEILSRPVTFADFNISAGATICFPNIPPHTSLILKQMPPASITARYLSAGREISLSGNALTTGFDAGHYSATLEVTPGQWGALSYFAVTFPADCQQRIVSSLPQEVFVHSASTEKVCYFSGGGTKLEYVIELSGGEAAVAESSGLGLKLAANGTRWLHERDPSVVTWSGDVSSIHIAVFGGQPDNRAVSHVLSNRNPVMIPLQTGGEERLLSEREQYFQQGRQFDGQDRRLPFRPHPGPLGRWDRGGLGAHGEDWHWQHYLAQHALQHRPLWLLFLGFPALWVLVAILGWAFVRLKRRQCRAAQDVPQAMLMPSVVYVASPGSQQQAFMSGQTAVQFQQPDNFQYQQPPFQIQPHASVPIDPRYQYGVPILS
jgi:hypothetical protein